ncbi:MAG: DUF4468 domain-containing protein [Cytophagaceae bacterium]
MKIIVAFCLLITASLSLSAQTLPTDAETKKITFQETVNMDSLSKSMLYDRCKNWMTNYYKSTKFDLDDKSSRIGMSGYFLVTLTYDFKYKAEYNVAYNISFNLKDGKYRYTITDFTVYKVATGPKTVQPAETAYAKMTTANKKEFVTQVNAEVSKLIEDMKVAVKSGKMKDQDDW